jgi:hypothetical protein
MIRIVGQRFSNNEGHVVASDDEDDEDDEPEDVVPTLVMATLSATSVLLQEQSLLTKGIYRSIVVAACATFALNMYMLQHNNWSKALVRPYLHNYWIWRANQFSTTMTSTYASMHWRPLRLQSKSCNN